MKRIIIFLTFLSFLCSCRKDDGWWTITMSNDSNRDIVFFVSLSHEGEGLFRPYKGWPENERQGKYIKKNSIGQVLYYWREIDHSADSMSLFVFSPDTLSKYSWAEIGEDNNYLKRYDLEYKKNLYRRFAFP